MGDSDPLGALNIEVRPSDGNMLVMHFVLHSLPPDTPFGEGCYHGIMAFPPEYPHSPPAARMLWKGLGV